MQVFGHVVWILTLQGLPCFMNLQIPEDKGTGGCLKIREPLKPLQMALLKDPMKKTTT